MSGVSLLVETNAGADPHQLRVDGITLGEHAGPYPTGRRFILRGRKYEGSVVAGAVALHEDTGEYSDPAFWDIEPQ